MPKPVDRRSASRSGDTRWRTALTAIAPNKILVRGYPLDEIMGRLTFGEAIYTLLMGEVPPPAIGSLMEAILVSFIDHGATPPSTLAARNTASTGAPLRSCVAAGVLGFGQFPGGDLESCLRCLDPRPPLVRPRTPARSASATSRCARSIPRITSTTGRRSGGSLSGASRKAEGRRQKVEGK